MTYSRAIETIASSKIRLAIASSLSDRPRTLGELAELNGVSVQAILKHLSKLSREGLIREESLRTGEHLKARKLYTMRDSYVDGYVQDEMVMVSLTKRDRAGGSGGDQERESESGVGVDAFTLLENTAAELMFRRGRVRDLIKRFDRLRGEIASERAKLGTMLGDLNLSSEERQIAYLIFTESSLDGARAALRRDYGCKDPADAVREVIAKLKKEKRVHYGRR